MTAVSDAVVVYLDSVSAPDPNRHLIWGPGMRLSRERVCVFVYYYSVSMCKYVCVCVVSVITT